MTNAWSGLKKSSGGPGGRDGRAFYPVSLQSGGDEA